MKRFYFFCLGMQIFAVSIFAQNADTTYWTQFFQIGANLNQAQFSDNWKAGGITSISLGTFFLGKANYRKAKINWDNTADFAYGFVNNKGESFTRKTSDRIFLDSKFGYSISPKWGFFGSINFQSQFAPGYVIDSLVKSGKKIAFSNFMAPGFATYSLGMELVPVSYLKIRFGTGTLRQTFVLDTTVYLGEGVPVAQRKRFGLKPGRRVRTEVAFQLQAELSKNLMENLNLKIRYLAFANYETLELQKIDHRLDLILTAKVNKYISATLNIVGLYDYDQSLDLQYSQSLGIGLLYQF